MITFYMRKLNAKLHLCVLRGSEWVWLLGTTWLLKVMPNLLKYSHLKLKLPLRTHKVLESSLTITFVSLRLILGSIIVILFCLANLLDWNNRWELPRTLWRTQIIVTLEIPKAKLESQHVGFACHMENNLNYVKLHAFGLLQDGTITIWK